MSSNKKESGFILFAKEMKDELSSEGLDVSNLKNLITFASPYWNKLSKYQKELYKKKAQNYGYIVNKMRNLNIEQYDNRTFHKENNHQQKYNKNFLSKYIPFNRFANEEFLFISFNYFDDIPCDTTQILCNDATERREILSSFEYLNEHSSLCCIPVEVSIIKCNLQYGIIDIFHDYINPGKIPMGYGICVKESSDINGIPANGLTLNDALTSIQKLKLFLNNNDGVFVSTQAKIHKITYCLHWLYFKAGLKMPFKDIISSEELVNYTLTNYTKADNKTLSMILSKLTSTELLYSLKNRCQFHDKIDSYHCSTIYSQIMSTTFMETKHFLI